MKKDSTSRNITFLIAMIGVFVIREIGIKNIPYQLLIVMSLVCIIFGVIGVKQTNSSNATKKEKGYLNTIIISIIISLITVIGKMMVKNIDIEYYSVINSILNVILLGSFFTAGAVSIIALFTNWGNQKKI